MVRRGSSLIVSFAGALTLVGLVPAATPVAAARTTPRRLAPVRVAALHNTSAVAADVNAPTSVHIVTPVSTQSVSASTHIAVGWAGSDSGSGIASYDVRLRVAAWNGSFGGYGTWRSATTARSATYATSSGRTVCFSVRARDNAANISSWSTDRCTTTPLDDRSLTSSGFAHTASRSAFAGTLSTTTSKSASLTRTGIVARTLAILASTCASCGTLQARWNGKTIKTISLAGGSATRVLGVASFPKLTKGTLQLVVTSSGKRVTVDAIEVENTPATGSITLAGGATYTKSRTITVSSSVAATSGAVRMRLANGSSLGSTPYSSYASNRPFTLSSGDGAKFVAAQFADAAGNVSAVATDDIVLDTTPPVVTNTTPGTAELPTGDVTITATLADASPIASVALLTAPIGTSTFTTTPMTVDANHFTATLPAVQASFDYTLRVVDAAGNVGTLPVTAPTDRFHVTIDPPPTSDQLIADALAKQTIDYPTSLVYRLWAQFGDPQLPAQYVGTGTGADGEDQSLFIELIDQRGQLSPAQQAQVDRYLVRPGDPGSAYAPPPPASARLRRAADPTGADCSQGLHFSDSATLPIRVWSCPDVDPNRATVLADMEPLYTAEQADMGSWVSDASSALNGGDGKLDVYVIPADKCINRSPTCEGIPDGAVARAVPAEPITTVGSRRTSSGYILVGSDRVTKPTLKSDLAHEFFHVLQYAHNLNALSKVVTPGTVPVYDNSWFAEASASWAEFHYANAEAKQGNYQIFTTDFQPVNKSLLTFEQAKDGHQYASWIWPLYMEQKNGASAVFNAWAGADNVTTPAQFDDVISNQLPFDKNFRNFSVQNWNEEMQGNPVPTWQDAPLASDFPLGDLHTATNTGTIGASPDPMSENVKIDALAAQYDGYDIKPGTDKITLDFSDVTNVDNLDIDILGRFKDNTWKHIAETGPKVELCTQRADEAFDFIRVVLSNHAKDRTADGSGPDPAKQISGAGVITTGTCARVEGTISWTYNHSGPLPGSPQVHDDYTESGSMTVSFEPATFPGTNIPLPGFQVQDDGSSTFTRSMHETLDSVDSNGCETNIGITGDRSGNFTPNPGPGADETTAGVSFEGFDPATLDIGAVGKLAAAIPVVDHVHTVITGPSDSCNVGTSDMDVKGDLAPGGLTCTPKLPDGVSDPFGPGGFDGVMNNDGKGNVTFDFTCSSATATTGPTTIQGPLNVSGTLYVHAQS